MKKFNCFLLFAATIMLFACDSANEVTPPDDSPTVEPIVDLIEINLPEIELNEQKQLILSEQETNIAENSIDFAFRYINALNETAQNSHDNIVSSPLSSYIALSLMANGAYGDTQKEIFNSMGIASDEINSLNSFNYKIINSLNQIRFDATVDMATALFAKENTTDIRQNFLDVVNQYYSAEYFDINNSNGIDLINQWVNEKTNGLIPALLDKNYDISSTELSICNTLYFNSVWASMFNPDKTYTDNFYNYDGSVSEIKFMKRDFHWKMYEGDDFTTIEMNLGFTSNPKNGFDVYLIAPNEGIDISTVLKKFDSNQLREVIKLQTPNPGQLHLPLLKLQNDIDLIATAKFMGIEKAFKPEAEFYRMSNSGLFINTFKQKNVFNMLETGVEAATSTYVDYWATGSGGSDEVKHFYINHPYMIVLIERSTGVILYAGVVKTL